MRIVTWDGLNAEVRGAVADESPLRPGASASPEVAPPPPVARPPDTPLPRLIGRGFRRANVPALRLTPQEWALLDLLARHPLISRDLAAWALGWGDEMLRRRRNALIERGLARRIPRAELGGGRGDAAALDQLAAREPAEATAAGIAALAAWQGLTVAAAVRWNGLAGCGPGTAIGTRPSLLAASLHTLGVEEFFADLARRARLAARRGADEGLVEWRNAAACARMWFRPDGYLVYRRGDDRHAAFLEYDRGSMGPRDWGQKLGAYHAYRDSGRSRREYAGFPALLIVVAADGAEDAATRETAHEGIIAEELRKLAVGRALIPALLTTATRLAIDPAGPLGPVWREAGDGHRRHWLRLGQGFPPSRRGLTPGERGPPDRPPRPSCARRNRVAADPSYVLQPSGGTLMINRCIALLIDDLRAEGIADPLAQSFTLAALWDDLAAAAGEVPPPFVEEFLSGGASLRHLVRAPAESLASSVAFVSRDTMDGA